MAAEATILTRAAPAKVNLTLRVGLRRADGYHDIDSLVAFAGLHDVVRLAPDAPLALTVEGPTAAAAGAPERNLVLVAARHLLDARSDLRAGHLFLTKNLPAAAGLGGGSSDAAAALRLLADLNALPPDNPDVFAAARTTGADVAVCLDPRARIMRGTGDILSAPLRLPPLPCVLVNPGVATPTAAVFAAFDRAASTAPLETGDIAIDLANERTLMSYLNRYGNDLEAPAISLCPAIADVLEALRAQDGCRLARMSGSGATCFGLFDAGPARAAARSLQARHPDWWIRESVLGDPQ
ncbi:MAG: 4-diphosphocytidyl-2-C-methyl-D-erythritol kinase [Alphaproteobacteria bacterium]|nr:MAG: 4-diphosphocytidyl-2-C-methyl-D-erythritol kinase [Alphaproteobacteria bacterium]